MSFSTTQLGEYTFSVHGEFDMRACGDCGVLWAMPVGFIEARRNDHRTWYCPNGHPWVYHGESETEKYKRLYRETRDREARKQARLDQTEASLRATKGVVTKQRKKLARVKYGVCPCCNRHFENVEAHMATEHPDFDPAAAPTG